MDWPIVQVSVNIGTSRPATIQLVDVCIGQMWYSVIISTVPHSLLLTTEKPTKPFPCSNYSFKLGAHVASYCSINQLIKLAIRPENVVFIAAYFQGAVEIIERVELMNLF